MNSIPMNFKSFLTNSYSDRLSYTMAINRLYKDLFVEKNYEFSYLDFPKKCIKKVNKGNSFPNNLFHLLNAYELKFLEGGLKEKYPKVYYQIYYCFYRIYFKWENEESVKNIRNWIQKKWLTVCFNSLSDESLKFWLESRIIDPQRPIDVEEDVRNVLFDKEGNLEKEFQENKGEMQFYASRAIDWYLKRYDWKSALSIYGKKNRKKFLFPIVLILLNIIFLCSITWDFIYSLFYSNVQSELSKNLFAIQTKDVICKNAIIGTPYYMEWVLSILLSAIIIIVCIKGFELVRFFLPRLIGAVFIGFIPLVAGPEMFTFPLRLNWIQISGISFVLFLLAFFYLIIECHTMIGKKGKRGIFRRSFPVILYGLFVSFIMSLFICDITAVDFIDYSKAINYTGYKGLCGGVIYPRIVIFYAPAALLIGIFIQIFWEEKTITEPL